MRVGPIARRRRPTQHGTARVSDVRVSPDGARLLAMARGERQPRPFHYRWLLPKIVGRDPARWVLFSRLMMACLCLASALYCRTAYAFLIPFALSGVVLNLKLPILVDLAAMVYVLDAALCARVGWWIPAILFVLAAGATKETAPVFAALYAWNPLLLVGLLAPAIRSLWKPGVDTSSGPMADALTHPWQASRKAHAGQWRNPLLWLLPWGILLVGASRPSWQVAATLIVAYAQTLIATDTIRLYMWAWPVLAARTFEVVPHRWWLLVVVAAFANPFGGTGI